MTSRENDLLTYRQKNNVFSAILEKGFINTGTFLITDSPRETCVKKQFVIRFTPTKGYCSKRQLSKLAMAASNALIYSLVSFGFSFTRVFDLFALDFVFSTQLISTMLVCAIAVYQVS